VLAVLLAVVVVAVVRGPGPLDDPRQGDQRTGLLVDPDEARSVEDLPLPGDPVGRRPVVVLFDRRVPPAAELRALLADIPPEAAVVLVVTGPIDRPVAVPDRVRVVTAAGRRLAERLGLPTPKDGGAPVGYALLDERGRVRYATLDPTYLEHGFEFDIVVDAVT
jgi:hypothetical protein